MILVMYSCMKNVDVKGDDLLNERMHCRVICSCIHKYPEAMIRILCIQEAMFMIRFR